MAGAEGIRLSLSLVDLMNLNLVHRRLQRIAESGEFVTPEDVSGLVEVLDGVFGPDATNLRDQINLLRRQRHGAR